LFEVWEGRGRPFAAVMMMEPSEFVEPVSILFVFFLVFVKVVIVVLIGVREGTAAV
jgi:hypothetical protein